ncbi:hypothetical protein ACVV2G_23825 [Streptomyces ziwulingensis]
MESYTSLARTVRRLDRAIDEQGLARSESLNPSVLAAGTALPESVVRHLLAGREPPDDTVNERVCGRIKALSDAYLRRHGKILKDLAAEVSARTGISDVWARAVCDGKKTPNVELLHHLVGFSAWKAGSRSSRHRPTKRSTGCSCPSYGSWRTRTWAPGRPCTKWTRSRHCWTGTAW